MSQADLADVVVRLQQVLYRDDLPGHRSGWNADKPWDSETLAAIGALMAEMQLSPDPNS